jgi:hypothetical protein
LNGRKEEGGNEMGGRNGRERRGIGGREGGREGGRAGGKAGGRAGERERGFLRWVVERKEAGGGEGKGERERGREGGREDEGEGRKGREGGEKRGAPGLGGGKEGRKEGRVGHVDVPPLPPSPSLPPSLPLPRPSFQGEGRLARPSGCFEGRG